MDFDLNNYDYILPPTAIAQAPAEPRDHSRLLVAKADGHAHHHFYDLPDLLQPGDLLVLNDTKVLPARLIGQRAGGGAAEIFLLREEKAGQWECLVRPGRKLLPGVRVSLPQGVEAEILTIGIGGTRQVQFHMPVNLEFWAWLDQAGTVPLPPYITPGQTTPDQYQTVWAQHLGAVAAPTAGLHFTQHLLQNLAQHGISTVHITLHVGVGTFRPVQVTDIRQHTLHHEWLRVPEAAVIKIRHTQAAGGRVIAVGTTVARSLESASQSGELVAWEGWSDLFIYPGYRWQTVEGLITNFHLPKSSLMMMVSSLIGRERLLTLYQEAITQNYRFYSFGDAFLIDPRSWSS